MQRVLHISAGNLYGGVETFLVTLARCRDLCPEMVPEFALCFSGRLEGELRQAGVAVHLLGAVRFSRPWTVWRARAALRSLLAREQRFDVVVCHIPWTQALFGGVVRNCGIPYVAHFHNPFGNGWQDYLARRQRPQLIVAPNSYCLDSVRSQFPDVTGEVLHYPLTAQITEAAELTAERRLAIRTGLRVRPDDVVILQASRIERWKGPDLVLRALGQLKDLPNWRFWLVGGPQRDHERSYFQELKSIVGELRIEDRVDFLGQRSDVPIFMRAADIYCQGNRGPESFGLSYLEACYCGLPIVITLDGGALWEWIDLTMAIPVAQENVEEFAQALRTCITDAARRKAMGACAKNKAIELCDPQKQLHQLFSVLAQASGRKGAVEQGDVVVAGG